MIMSLLLTSLKHASCLQSHLPPDGKPFGIILYADKTKLLSFGTAQGYPVVMRCLNLPGDIHDENDISGGQVVGWLPIVSCTPHINYGCLNHKLWHQG